VAINARDYIAKFTPAEREAIQAGAEEMIAEELNLAELREKLKRSQREIAEKCGIKQAALSRLERRADMRISTLRKLAKAMGGTLQIAIRFPDRRPVRISQFVPSPPRGDQAYREPMSEADLQRLGDVIKKFYWKTTSKVRLQQLREEVKKSYPHFISKADSKRLSDYVKDEIAKSCRDLGDLVPEDYKERISAHVKELLTAALSEEAIRSRIKTDTTLAKLQAAWRAAERRKDARTTSETKEAE
jgi:transcriptional regulator with XRE-family HTH domain